MADVAFTFPIYYTMRHVTLNVAKVADCHTLQKGSKFMENKTFLVPDIGCSGCVRTVETTVKQIAGVRTVTADEQTKLVVVQWDAPATWQEIKTALTEVDYPPAES